MCKIHTFRWLRKLKGGATKRAQACQSGQARQSALPCLEPDFKIGGPIRPKVCPALKSVGSGWSGGPSVGPTLKSSSHFGSFRAVSSIFLNFAAVAIIQETVMRVSAAPQCIHTQVRSKNRYYMDSDCEHRIYITRYASWHRLRPRRRKTHTQLSNIINTLSVGEAAMSAEAVVFLKLTSATSTPIRQRAPASRTPSRRQSWRLGSH